MTRQQMLDISLVLDGLAVCISLFLARELYPILVGLELRGDASYSLVAIVTGLLHYVVTQARYAKPQQPRNATIWSVLQSLAITFAIVIVIGYALKQTEVHSRLWIALSFAISFTLIMLKEWALGVLMRTPRWRRLFVERIAIFGETSMVDAINRSLAAESGRNYETHAYCTDRDMRPLNKLIVDGLSRAYDRIIFCIPSDEIENVVGLMNAISFLPGRVEVCLAQAELTALRRTWPLMPRQILVSANEPRPSDWASLTKRMLDLTLGSLALVALSPVMVLAAIAIKCDSSGPAFFRQRRHGWNHSIISVWKFRTMTVQEDGMHVKQATQNDTRVTRVGRFLRKTSIDELPQLFNVLSGEMSLVGPRPHALVHNLHYSSVIGCYAARHKVKPGITGWAQVKGFRGNSEDISRMVERAEADIWYIRNWSVLLDIKILIMTPIVVLFQKNAF